MLCYFAVPFSHSLPCFGSAASRTVEARPYQRSSPLRYSHLLGSASKPQRCSNYRDEPQPAQATPGHLGVSGSGHGLKIDPTNYKMLLYVTRATSFTNTGVRRRKKTFVDQRLLAVSFGDHRCIEIRTIISCFTAGSEMLPKLLVQAANCCSCGPKCNNSESASQWCQSCCPGCYPTARGHSIHGEESGSSAHHHNTAAIELLHRQFLCLPWTVCGLSLAQVWSVTRSRGYLASAGCFTHLQGVYFGERITDVISSHQALYLRLHILRRLQHAPASVGVSERVRPHLRTSVCLCMADL